MINQFKKNLIRRYLPVLLAAITFFNLIPVRMVFGMNKDSMKQISNILSSLEKQGDIEYKLIIKDKDCNYKEVKLKGTASIINKDGNYQLDDKGNLSKGTSETNYYFERMNNNIITDPELIAKFETIHVANKYLSSYNNGFDKEQNYYLWTKTKKLKGSELMDFYYK